MSQPARRELPVPASTGEPPAVPPTAPQCAPSLPYGRPPWRRTRAAQRHQAMLVANLTPYSPAYQQRLDALTAALGLGGDPGIAEDRAQAVIQALLRQQATLLAFVDDFRLFAAGALLCLPLLLLFRKVRGGAPPGAH